MEEYYRSSCWHDTDAGGVVRPDGSYDGYLPYTWDRINTYLAPFPLNFSNWLNFGDAKCGSGYQAVGKVALYGTNLFSASRGAGSAVGQDFTWSGGTAYWRMSARGKFSRVLPPTPQGKAIAYIYGGLNQGSEQRYELLLEEDLTLDWQTFTGSIELPEGTYTIFLDAWDKERFLATTIDDGVVYYDDVVISHAQISDTACTVEQPNPTPTPDLTTTSTDFSTVTATQSWGWFTPTWDGSPTMTMAPELLNIYNCGFEAGANVWGHNVESYIGLDGGPRGPQYAFSTGYAPSWYQRVQLSVPGMVYLTAWVKGDANIRMVNTDTGTTTTMYLSPGYLWTWTKVFASSQLSAGNYRLELNTKIPPLGEAMFDGITLSYNTYATEDQSWCAVDPTPGPTPYVTPTTTRTPTTGPSGTPLATSTPIPSLTAWASWTPDLTRTAAIGPTATSWQSTYEAMLTSTAQGTPQPTPLIIGGTIIPPWQYTPGVPLIPPPQQPPGGQYAVCSRPGGWDMFWVGYWIDYGICEAKVFVSWGDGNTAQVTNFYTGLQSHEPFGTLKEVDDTIKVASEIFNTYNWSGSGGAPGVNTVPNPYIFTNPGPSIWTGSYQSIVSSGPVYSQHCDVGMEQALGSRLGGPICFIFDILYKNNLTPWFQFFINISTLVGFGIYLKRNWLDVL